MRNQTIKILGAASILCASPSFASLVGVRSIDGTGTNLSQPQAGAADAPLIRHDHQADYPGDGSGSTILSDADRANARDISNLVAMQAGDVYNDRHMSDYIWLWGQFLDHDIDLTEADIANGDASIAVLSPNDPLGPNPIPFSRSNYDPSTGTGSGHPRQQMNQITSYIDASNIYGSDDERAAELRTMVGGKLTTSQGDLPMFNTVGLPNAGGTGPDLFLSGDVRANENVGLTSMHTVFVREHNRLADRIAQLDPQADDELIYQTARKIIGAQMQIITYREFLPALLGEHAPYVGDLQYDASIDATIANEFAHAAYRFGHSMVASTFQLIDDQGTVSGLALRDAFFNPGFLADDPDRVEQLLRGAATQRAQEIDSKLVEDLRSFLFGPAGAGGMDLAALNIQRGRDHGLPSYNYLRMAYGLSGLTGFDQITDDTQLQQALADLYDGDINNVDAWVGLLAEDHLTGASAGALLHAILSRQFEALAKGDRFFYLNDPDLYDANGQLLAGIRDIVDLDQLTLGQVIQRNTGITGLASNVFFVPEPAGSLCLALGGLGWLARLRRRGRRITAN